MNVIAAYWKDFQDHNPEYIKVVQPQAYHYCDNEKDADTCAGLVVAKIKQATSPSLWWFEKFNEKLPRPGDLAIITTWNGEPKAIIKTTRVEIVKFKDIGPEHAFIEGEDDRSLQYWKDVHWQYYTNEMKEFGEHPTEDMEIVCEYFETIW